MCWECARASGGDGWRGRIAGIDSMHSRCSTSSTIASRPLLSLDPCRHSRSWTSASGTSARSICARRPPAVGQSHRAPQALWDCPKVSFRCQHSRAADAPNTDVQRQVRRGRSREGSGRDSIVPLLLQRDCMVSVPAIRASQPSPTRALAHFQHILTGRSRSCSGCCS